jgi:cell shape-determining protein MreC
MDPTQMKARIEQLEKEQRELREELTKEQQQSKTATQVMVSR